MPKTHVSRKINIAAPITKVHDTVTNLKTWPIWSPWLNCEPEATVQFEENGKKQSWDGKRVGTGEIALVKETPHQIEYDLTFLKPWKSKAKVFFNLTEKDGATQAEWVMDSSLPFFMFWMKKKMETFIGMDYVRGLTMLKQYVEEDKVDTQLEFDGSKQYDGFSYIGIKNQCTIKTLPQVMSKDFEQLMNFVSTHELEITHPPYSQYHTFDFMNEKVVYTAGFPVKEMPDNLPSNMIQGAIPPMKMNVVRHIGKYDYLGNAWNAAMMMARKKEFKQNKKVHPFEFYLNSPQDVKPEELVTEIAMAIK